MVQRRGLDGGRWFAVGEQEKQLDARRINTGSRRHKKSLCRQQAAWQASQIPESLIAPFSQQNPRGVSLLHFVQSVHTCVSFWLSYKVLKKRRQLPIISSHSVRVWVVCVRVWVVCVRVCVWQCHELKEVRNVSFSAAVDWWKCSLMQVQVCRKSQ